MHIFLTYSSVYVTFHGQRYSISITTSVPNLSHEAQIQDLA